MNSTPAMQERLVSDEQIMVAVHSVLSRLDGVLLLEKMREIMVEQRDMYEAHIAALTETLEFASTYKGYEARACPLCRYEHGKFIESCQMHKDMHALHARIDALEAELATAQATPLPVSEEVVAIVALWRKDIADRAASWLSLNAENMRGAKYKTEVQLIDAWLDSIKETRNA